MARCDYIDPVTGDRCDWVGKKSGRAIHMAKQHGVHPVHDEVESESGPVVLLNPSCDNVSSGDDRLMEPMVDRWDGEALRCPNPIQNGTKEGSQT